jgi:hypothetical protein
MQLHWDVMRSDNAGDLWYEVSGNLPTDFGFPIDVHAHEAHADYANLHHCCNSLKISQLQHCGVATGFTIFAVFGQFCTAFCTFRPPAWGCFSASPQRLSARDCRSRYPWFY